MTLTVETLQRLAAEASTLAERLRGDVLPAADAPPEAEAASGARRVDRWRRALGAGSPSRLERRLAWDGLTLDHARTSVGEVRWPADRPLPEWTAMLADCAALADSAAAGSGDVGDRAVPFGEVLEPLVVAARRRLVERCPRLHAVATPAALDDAAAELRRHLAAVAGRTLLAEFDVFRARRGVVPGWPGAALGAECYRAFVGAGSDGPRGRLLALAERYPVLGRLLATRTMLWVAATAELFERLAHDAATLRDVFGLAEGDTGVARLRSGLSDSHRGGRSVAILEFPSGRAVVYKPRPVSVERAYGDLLAWLDVARPGPAHRRLRVLERGDYGWVEFADARPCDDDTALERYYHRAGSLLCIAYVLGAADLHLGNVIASGEYPVLVDLEVLFATPLAWGGDARDEARRRDVEQLWASVLRTGLLPQRFRLANGPAVNLSGLAAAGDDVPMPRLEWQHVNTDAMTVRRTAAPISASNLPLVGGTRAAAARFLPQLVAGFEETYDTLRRRRRALLARTGPLAAFRRASARVLLRTTSVYSALLERTLHPRFLTSGVERSVELESLAMAALLDGASASLGAVAAAEARNLEQLDVPLFLMHADETTLRDEAGRALGPCVTTPGFADVERRARGLSDADRRRQVDLIVLAFRAEPEIAATARAGATAGSEPAPPDPAEAARRIAATLSHWARRDGDDARWTGFVRLPNPRVAGLGDIGVTLKDGACGVALFLAALARADGDGAARALCLDALRPLLRALAHRDTSRALVRNLGIGGAGGMGGVTYALTRAAELLGDEPSLLLGAERAAATITRERVMRDQALDVCYGAAGAALGLLALAQRSGDRDVLRRARWCGERLLATAVPLEGGAYGWRTMQASSGAGFPAGFAHGAAGIAHALRRLHATLDDPRLLRVARGAQRLVRTEVRARAGVDGADRARAGALDPSSWCAGITGMGLASAAALALDDDPGLAGDVEASLAALSRAPLGVTDHPCCGNAGRIELLLAAGADHDERRARARQLAQQIVTRAEQRGGFQTGAPTMLSPSFFQGVAGVGYELLRAAHPSALPCVFTWQ